MWYSGILKFPLFPQGWKSQLLRPCTSLVSSGGLSSRAPRYFSCPHSYWSSCVRSLMSTCKETQDQGGATPITNPEKWAPARAVLWQPLMCYRSSSSELTGWGWWQSIGVWDSLWDTGEDHFGITQDLFWDEWRMGQRCGDQSGLAKSGCIGDP